MDAREAAYLALLSSLRQEKFISHALEQWQQHDRPSTLDYAFAQELALGACRMAKSLDYLAVGVSAKRTISVKVKERALLRLALYQYYFMDKVPLYAIANETMKLANKYCHRTFAAFLNAILRKLEDAQVSLPIGHTVEDLSIRYSYPDFFVSILKEELSIETLEGVLEAGNSPAKTTVRLRPGWEAEAATLSQYLVPSKAFSADVVVLNDKNGLEAVIASPWCYVQNVTPASLVAELAASTLIPPESILDLCASPGGKLLAAHDAFPAAELFGNDVSTAKLERLQSNLDKYGVNVLLSCGNGEDFVSERAYDLIILDVPCSNSGVLNKRPEARWRLSAESLADLEATQRRLIDHAATLLSPEGAIWYMTCSILKSENADMTRYACSKHGLKSHFSKTFLPDKEGWDGGYGCLLRRVSHLLNA